MSEQSFRLENIKARSAIEVPTPSELDHVAPSDRVRPTRLYHLAALAKWAARGSLGLVIVLFVLPLLPAIATLHVCKKIHEWTNANERRGESEKHVTIARSSECSQRQAVSEQESLPL